MTINRSILALLAYLAAVLFFALAAFEVTLDDVPLIAVGLLCCAIGFAIDHLPA